MSYLDETLSNISESNFLDCSILSDQFLEDNQFSVTTSEHSTPTSVGSNVHSDSEEDHSLDPPPS